MVLPLNLAMNASEMSSFSSPGPIAWMACHFSAYTNGIANLPDQLPPGSMLILNDRYPCQGHSPDLVAGQIREAVENLGCESVLLDFQRPPTPEATAIVEELLSSLPCPMAVSESYTGTLSCPLFLPTNPLHIPLEEYLKPWKGREVWLEAALCQESITVTKQRVQISPCFPTDHLDGGFFDEGLLCHYITELREDAVKFTLFDTPESLIQKLDLAHSLGVSRAVGLYQELGPFPFPSNGSSKDKL